MQLQDDGGWRQSASGEHILSASSPRPDERPYLTRTHKCRRNELGADTQRQDAGESTNTVLERTE